MSEPADLIVYDTGNEDEQSFERIENTLQKMGYDANESYQVLRSNRETARSIGDYDKQRRFSTLIGCAHPNPAQCSVCSGVEGDNVDPFIDREVYGHQLGILRDMLFVTPQEAQDGYTFFNMIWDWRRRREIKLYFEQNYPIIADAITDIHLGIYKHTDDRTDDQAPSSTPYVPPNTFTRGRTKKFLPYCSWVCLPAFGNKSRDNYGMHFVDVKMPLVSETISYLMHMLNPPPDFATKIFSVSISRSASSSSVAMATHKKNVIKGMMPRRRSSPNIALAKTTQRFSNESASIKLRRVTSITQAHRRSNTERNLESTTTDPRPGRSHRLEKIGGVQKQFDEGNPKIVLISDRPVLEKRADYNISQSEEYCNIFFLRTPTGPPPSLVSTRKHW